MLKQRGVDFEIVDYLKTPLDRATLASLASMLTNPVELIRTDKRFHELGLDIDAYQEPGRVVELLLKHPELMQRPIAVRDGRAVIARPPDRLLSLIEDLP